MRNLEEVKTQWSNLRIKAVKYDLNKKKTGKSVFPSFDNAIHIQWHVFSLVLHQKAEKHFYLV